tara:strand:+ start:6625 stop:7305 length:681 start_codon:yes stop_codon:yes gene_type:complete
MLQQRLGLSLPTQRKLGGAWSPTDDTDLLAWYQKNTGITLSGADVSNWEDSSGNAYHMAQTDAAKMPEWNVAGEYLEFDGTGEHLSSSSQMSITADFTVGVKLNPVTPFGTVLADVTIGGEWLRIISTNTLRVKIDNTGAIDLTLDSGVWSSGYLVLTRVSGVISMWWNGVLQAGTDTKTGIVDIDAIGIRQPANNPFNGDITEIQIYKNSSASLSANVNDRLASL